MAVLKFLYGLLWIIKFYRICVRARDTLSKLDMYTHPDLMSRCSNGHSVLNMELPIIQFESITFHFFGETMIYI